VLEEDEEVVQRAAVLQSCMSCIPVPMEFDTGMRQRGEKR
jgi:hypothetical protein